MKKKKLRSGYTTGACAAAAAKGAVIWLLSRKTATGTDIPFPDGSRVFFKFEEHGSSPLREHAGTASVIKDAGDDPDVTNGAEIAAHAWFSGDNENVDTVTVIGGEGVGTVTKPGLAVDVGKPAINPVPLNMIRASVLEALNEHDTVTSITVEITIPEGETLARKTLNERLGIIGGLSVLGTTGIVRPISAAAWTATITSAMKVAKANGNAEIVLSTGRTSESAIEKTKRFKDEALIMMGDYLEFSLKEAGKFGFDHIHISGMWAKVLKAALRTPQTHVRFGPLEAHRAAMFIQDLKPDKDLKCIEGANTSREIFDRLEQQGEMQIIRAVCCAAKKYQEEVSRLPVTIYLVHPTGKIVVTV